ncbi:MAG: DNA mismatch repair endonuclease MutL [Treponema sp.]|nr:DNA mismatch repair endonuclease MutL [Treponema sp.]
MSQIKVLPPEEAKRIAAGEVVDRPAALLREFLDNAIDAGAANIEVSIEDGGCKKAEVSDDGAGMTLEDLEICWLTHATSKIRSLNDLETAKTLGFRGEALSAAAAVARLEIVTSANGREAWQLNTGPGESNPPVIEQTRRTKGTTVRAINLFETIPARKRFLKREGSEGLLCRQIFLDKALPFNKINFRFMQDGKIKDFLPVVSSKKERFAAALNIEADFLHEINVIGDGFSAAVVIGGPDLYRNDRRQIFIFANGRRIQDFSLVQAIEYGSQGWFPNGTHPVGAVYIEINPALADFNIHPAKREVRFKDSAAIHHAISGTVKSFFHRKTVAEMSNRNEEKISRRGAEAAIGEDLTQRHRNKENTRELFEETSHQDAKFTKNAKEEKREEHDSFSYNNSALPASLRPCVKSFVNDSSPHYVGRVFGLFILIEWGEKLYIIDQHAAHERILFNKFLEEGIPKQELLSPIPFCTESDDDDKFLELKNKEMQHLGLEIKRDESILQKGNWLIEALPSDWRMSDSATIKEILELRTAGENMIERWAAAICCHAAIKDGDYPDDETAFELGKEALNLPDPHCPHGRPIWTEIGREALYKAVRRD